MMTLPRKLLPPSSIFLRLEYRDKRFFLNFATAYYKTMWRHISETQSSHTGVMCAGDAEVQGTDGAE
jgi:hypothetical protein